MNQASPLLEISDLQTFFTLDERTIRSVDGVSFSVPRGRTVCVVGESGSGKSVTARSVLGLVDPPGKIMGGKILWHGNVPSVDGGTRRRSWFGRSKAETAAAYRDASGALDLARVPRKSELMRRMRGGEISMVFQEPMASLSPMYSVADHLVEAIRLHTDIGHKAAWDKGLDLLERVGIARARERMDAYPFQLSGGMCQRVMIAIALSCQPSLIIADEPTTALDVTTQAKIIGLFKALQREHGMAMLFITHDLGVVAEIADDVVVMYRGKVVEKGTVDQIFHAPAHAYTRQLLAAIPKMTRFDAKEGSVA